MAITLMKTARLAGLAGLVAVTGFGVLAVTGAIPAVVQPGPPNTPTAASADETTMQISAEPTTCKGHVLLTFDDGPHPEFTPRILRALEQGGASATFFAEGQLVEAHPDVAARIVQDGHRLENHTWDHPYLTTLSSEDVTAQLVRTNTAIEEATGVAPTQWRPPYEDYSADTQAAGTSLGLQMVLWDYETDTNDWRGASPEDIRDVVLDNATDGSTVLMHDRIENTATAVPMILDGLHQKGLCTR